MKSYGQLWEKIVSEENVMAGWLAFRKNHAHEEPVVAFERNLEKNLRLICDRLADGTWRPAGYHQFRITDPKPRTISCAPVKDRVVHHALCNIIAPLMERRFTSRSYACRKGYGSHLACQFARKLAGRYKYFLKIDIRHYFDTIDHDRLMEIIRALFRERRVHALCEAVIRYPFGGVAKGKGLPIGNLTSQWFANLYLDELDHALMDGKGVGGRYLRYMDDILIFTDSKAEAWALHDFIADWVGRERLLEIKEKATTVAPVDEGAPFLGMRIYPGAWRFKRSRFLRTRRSARTHYRAYLAGYESEEKLQSVITGMEGSVEWYGFKGIFRSVEETMLREAAGGGGSSENRVNRGGSYNNDASNCCPSYRNNNTASNENDNNGFRLVSICKTDGILANPILPGLRFPDGKTNMHGSAGASTSAATCSQSPRRIGCVGRRAGEGSADLWIYRTSERTGK